MSCIRTAVAEFGAKDESSGSGSQARLEKKEQRASGAETCGRLPQAAKMVAAYMAPEQNCRLGCFLLRVREARKTAQDKDLIPSVKHCSLNGSGHKKKHVLEKRKGTCVFLLRWGVRCSFGFFELFIYYDIHIFFLLKCRSCPRAVLINSRGRYEIMGYMHIRVYSGQQCGMGRIRSQRPRSKQGRCMSLDA